MIIKYLLTKRLQVMMQTLEYAQANYHGCATMRGVVEPTRREADGRRTVDKLSASMDNSLRDARKTLKEMTEVAKRYDRTYNQ